MVSVNDPAGGVGVVVSIVAGAGLVNDDGVGDGVIGVVDQAAGMVSDVVWLGVVIVICEWWSHRVCMPYVPEVVVVIVVVGEGGMGLRKHFEVL